MILKLDGTPLPGKDPRISLAEQIERSDLSGDTSQTEGTHRGWKAAVLQYTCTVPFDEAETLGLLRAYWMSAVFEAGTGFPVEPKTWQVDEPTCAAMGITQARFTDFFRVAPDENLKLWRVSMNLIEVRSIPGRTEERAAPPEETQTVPEGLQTPTGQPAAPGDGALEGLLGFLDSAAGKLLGAFE